MEKKKYRESILEYEDVREVVEYAKELAAKEAYETGMVEARRQMISGMLDANLPIATISKITGLSENEIAACKL